MTDVLNEFRDETFNGPVDVDGNHYVGCSFQEGAQLRYGGGALPRFENCLFAGVSWYFHDAALRTIQLLQSQNMDGENQAFIDGIFRPGNLLGE
jgi:hypothetical protein